MRDGFAGCATARTEVDDGLPPGEGTFLACSFWLVDNLALQGRLDEAHGRLRAAARPLATTSGLLAEEYDPAAKRLVGNFPQAFSHVALVNTAGLNLMKHEQAWRAQPAQPSHNGTEDAELKAAASRMAAQQHRQ